MANGFYVVGGLEGLLAGAFALLSDDIRWSLIDAQDYTRDLATHDFYDDVPAQARVAESPALTGKSITGGVFDANDTTMTNVTGDPCEQLILREFNANDAQSRLILNIDTATGLPVTPNGGNINIVHDNGANKIFAITG